MQKHGFVYIRLYYIYIPHISYIHTKVPIISIFVSEILKGSSELIMLFYKRILILNMLITKVIIHNRFTPFPEFMYISLYTTIHIPRTSILNVKMSMFNEKRFKKNFKSILEKAFGKIDYLFS